jgi:hypothetical protein
MSLVRLTSPTKQQPALDAAQYEKVFSYAESMFRIEERFRLQVPRRARCCDVGWMQEISMEGG